MSPDTVPESSPLRLAQPALWPVEFRDSAPDAGYQGSILPVDHVIQAVILVFLAQADIAPNIGEENRSVLDTQPC